MAELANQVYAEILKRKRPQIESLAARLRCDSAAKKKAKDVANWSKEELAQLIPYCELIKSKQMSYYAVCVKLNGIMNRSFEAIRKKLKNYVNYGKFF